MLKSTVQFFVIIVALFVIIPTIYADDDGGNDKDARLVTVTGDADVMVVPDEVIITLGVHTWNAKLDIAEQSNEDIVKKTIKTIESFGIEAKHLKTEYFTINPTYPDYFDERTTNIDGYSVWKTIVVTLRDVPKFEDLLTAVLESGVTYVHGIQFRTTELRKHRDTARALAIKAAKEKATALAGELGLEIGKPQSIKEEYSNWWSWYGGGYWGRSYGGGMSQNVVQNAGGGSGTASDESAIAPGQITVNARVSVSFELK
ncbi:MAG TPA: SIMPL domain-containing protein [bacterium]